MMKVLAVSMAVAMGTILGPSPANPPVKAATCFYVPILEMEICF